MSLREEFTALANIVELAPVFAEVSNEDSRFVNGLWNCRTQTERLAGARGHTYVCLPYGAASAERVAKLLASADALVLAPTPATPAGSRQPADGAEAGRLTGHRLLDGLSDSRPDVHVVLVSHLLVGHGVTHKNARPHVWALRSLEHHLRGGRNPWTILRHTWLSDVHDQSYQTRLTQDQHADGMVSKDSVAAAVLTAIENPASASGRTAALFNLSIPQGSAADLAAQFAALEPDFEAEFSRQAVDG